MRPALVALAFAACWRGSDTIATAPVTPAPVVVADYRGPRRACPDASAFDPSNPECAYECFENSPDDWAGCRGASEILVRQGSACTSLHPRTCTPPAAPPPISPLGARVRIVGLAVTGNGVEIKIAAGSSMGITSSWKAMLVDAADRPVHGGTIQIVRVDTSITTGRVQLTPDQIKAAPFVRLQP